MQSPEVSPPGFLFGKKDEVGCRLRAARSPPSAGPISYQETAGGPQAAPYYSYLLTLPPMTASLAWPDLLVILAFLALSLGIGVYYSKKASGSLESFFLGGRSFPWWLSGISLVATTFAADTPLAVTELVAKNGIAGNWLWWNMMAGGMLTTLFFARLWWRSGILTDVELVEIRYGGKPAAFLRGFKAIYLGLFMNTLIIGWVNEAMITILQIFFGLSDSQAFWALAACMVLVAFYASLSGLWGVAVTDFFQFILAMSGCIALAFYVLDTPAVGGMAGINAKLSPELLGFFPRIGDGATTGGFALGIGSFLAYIGVQWWSSWYPGAEPGGGGYVAQRLMSAKSERDATLSSLLFQILHFCLRPWPWIIVALCTLLLYPGLANPKDGYVLAMRDHLPVGVKGLLLASFLAAYMSTVSSQFNWGAGYLTSDLYLRFFNPQASLKRQVAAGRIATVFIAALGLYVTQYISSISEVWVFMIEAGAGIGLVLILRWYWWRINAWSEITASIVPLVVYGLVTQAKVFGEMNAVFPNSFFIIVAATTVSWLLVTFLTNPESAIVLDKFYRRVRPEAGWEPVRIAAGLPRENGRLGMRLITWLAAIGMGYSTLFTSGSLLFQRWADAGLWATSLAICLTVFIILLRKGNVLAPTRPEAKATQNA